MGFLFFVLALGGAAPLTLDQAELDAISAKCHTPRTWMKSRGGVILRPSKTVKYEQINCLLASLRRANGSPVGFVGNETNESSKQPR